VTHPSAPPGCACDCCAGIAEATPQAVVNQAGRPAVAYRVGAYPQFRASLHAALSSAVRPALAALTTRDDTDFTIGLLDGVACFADVHTFYNERLVNEAFVRTATDPDSLAELGKLVGYRLRPGVAAATWLAFHVEPPTPARVAAASTPFQLLRMPTAVTIAAGTPVRGIPGPGEQSQTFETSDDVDARPEWSLMTPPSTRATVLSTGSTQLTAAGVATQLKPGDTLLFASGVTHWTWEPVATVTVQNAADTTLVTWKSELTAGAPLTPYVFRKRLAVFGANAPMWGSMSGDFQATYYKAAGGATYVSVSHGFAAALSSAPLVIPAEPGGVVFQKPEWPYFVIAGDGLTMAVDVDGSQPDIAEGDYLMMVTGAHRSLFTVASVQELSRAEFALSGKVTRVTLTGSSADYAHHYSDPRSTTVFAVPEEIALAGEPDPTPVAGTSVTVCGDMSALPPGRKVIVAGGGAADIMTLASATVSGSGNDATTVLAFTGGLTTAYDRTTVSVFGNVVPATHGETVSQILGDGQASVPFQRFTLAHSPLTYTRADTDAGAASTLQVRVNDVQWHEKPTLYGAGPRDRGFVTSDAPTGEVVVGFGDGATGARVPTGSHNVRAVYRKGIGAVANLPSGALTQLGSPPLGVTGVTNPVPATGGADPDVTADARVNIALSVRTLGRAVSLLDYADYARTFPGIAKAHAAVLPVGNVRTIVVTVAAAGGQEVADSVRTALASALRSHGDPLAPVTVVPHRPVPFAFSMTVRRDPDYEIAAVLAAVAAQLTAAFGFDARDFAQPVYRSEVIAAAHRAAGVVAVDLTVLTRTAAPAPAERLLADGPQPPPAFPPGQPPAGAELLTLAVDPTPWLAEMP
jgi:Baseplate J-like protein